MPTPNLTLPYIEPAQAQKHVTHNEALRRLDAIVQLAVLDHSLSAPPPGPAEGARYLVAAAATGDWAGHEDDVAVWEGGTWAFYPPQVGWQVWNVAQSQIAVWDGTAWVAVAAGGLPADITAQTLGLNASADAQNRLSVAAAGTLLNHDGAGHQLKLNKAASGDTASLLFQTGFSGRAEMGTTGADDFAVKVSPDGATWTTALTVNQTSGAVALVAGATVDGKAALHRGNVVGTVAQAAGLPTGAVIEQATTVNGSYVRFADGTQICTRYMTTSDTASVTWTFPAAFIDTQTQVTATAAAAAARIITVQGTTTVDVMINGWLTSGARVVVGANLVAVGRWF